MSEALKLLFAFIRQPNTLHFIDGYLFSLAGILMTNLVRGVEQNILVSLILGIPGGTIFWWINRETPENDQG